MITIKLTRELCKEEYRNKDYSLEYANNKINKHIKKIEKYIIENIFKDFEIIIIDKSIFNIEINKLYKVNIYLSVSFDLELIVYTTNGDFLLNKNIKTLKRLKEYYVYDYFNQIA